MFLLFILSHYLFTIKWHTVAEIKNLTDNWCDNLRKVYGWKMDAIHFRMVALNQTSGVTQFNNKNGKHALGKLLWKHNERVRRVLNEVDSRHAVVVVTGDDYLVVSQFNVENAVTVEVSTRDEWLKLRLREGIREYVRGRLHEVDIDLQ